MDYKRRFDAKLDALIASGNPAASDADVAMDFMYRLDNSRYAEFKAEVVNDMQKGSSVSLDDLNKMYVVASRRVVVKSGKDGGGATFATVDQTPKKGSNPRNGHGGQGDAKASDGGTQPEVGKTPEEKAASKLAKMKCFNCGGKGHPARNCPHKEKNRIEGEPMAGMTLGVCCASGSGRLHESHEVCIDNGSQVNIVNSRLLSNLRTSSRTYRSMSGSAETSRIGYLEGFFDCQACDDCPTSILSMSDVEDLYKVTYVQGESITVHMDERDVVFTRRDKMYVADFSDWLVEDQDRVSDRTLSLMTVKEKESLYTKKQVRKAIAAGEFLKALGYPSEKDALELLRTGNVRNIPHSADDISRFYTVYGPQVEALRGKTTRSHAKTRVMSDEGSKMQLTYQDMVMDVMHVAGQKFLISICTPLGLLLVCHVETQTAQELGRGVQKHLNTLRSRGFDSKRIMADPHKSFESLQGSFPGVEIDLSGAGDFLDRIDTKIRRVKELMRSVICGLPYRLPNERVKDLVTYAVGRLNLRSTETLQSGECPRVRFTGQNPEYSSELGLAFGDYVEAYNPKAHAKSNDVFVPRTEPCIALFPVMNANGSWVMFNLNTKAYVRRSQWRKCATTDNVINIMNQLAGETGVMAADIAAEQVGEEIDITERVALNQPTIMSEVDGQQTDDPEIPELEDQTDVESDDEAEDDESETGEFLDDGGERAIEELYQLLEEESSATDSSEKQECFPVRRSERTNAGIKKRDEAYHWNLMNLSVNAAMESFGEVASDACRDELVQLFVEKRR
jgi:hypothetical protein